jgi:hypothetical protein
MTPRRLREERVLHPPAGYVAGESFVLNAALFDVVQISVYLERRSAALELVALTAVRRRRRAR